MSIAKDMLNLASKVTREWTKQRKAEERNSRARFSREDVYSDRIHFADVADTVIPDGYEHASGGGKYTVSTRQLYYACREAFYEATDREISAEYFSQKLLVRFLNDHPGETASWRVTADPRGTLLIPNAAFEVRIPCGTLPIDEHLAAHDDRVDVPTFRDGLPDGVDVQWPSLAGGQRYQAVLYIEKEGFEPLLEDAKIAERYELAVLSCKGQSVVAARKFVDHVCREDGGVPLFVVHDFDKYGFEISECLIRVSGAALENNLVKYQFDNKIRVSDLGLRLADVDKYQLQSEHVMFKGDFAWNSICTADEQAYLRSNRRVELNAFTSPEFIEWLEGKLMALGLGKRLIPADDVLVAAYRRAKMVARMNAQIRDILAEHDDLDEIPNPATLRRLTDPPAAA